MLSNIMCSCGGEKRIKIGKYGRRFEPVSGVVSNILISSRYESAWYYPIEDERILEVSCDKCGLLYNMESIGKF